VHFSKVAVKQSVLDRGWSLNSENIITDSL